MPTREAASPLVVHLTTVHPRGDIRILHKECVSLAAAGHDVILLVADGRGDGIAQGVHIRDIGAAHNRARRVLLQPWRMLCAARRLHACIYHLHDPELLSIGWLLRRSGARVVYDSHEDLPRQILTKHWIPKRIRGTVSRIVEHVENFLVRRLDAVVAATPTIRRRFATQNGKVVEICNFPSLNDEALMKFNGRRNSRAICYIGGIMESRGAMQLLDALLMLPNVRLILCGSFDNFELERRMREHQAWPQVDYRGLVDRLGIRRALEDAAVGIVTLLPFPSYIDALPVKLFEYMAAGLPVVASDFPIWREIVDRAGCGVCVDPESPTMIARAVEQIMDSPVLAGAMGVAGRVAIEENYNWNRQASNLIELYRALVA